MFNQQVGEEEIIYKELVAIYLETAETSYVEKSVWERVNLLLERLSIKNPKYREYFLTCNNVAKSINVMTFKQKLRSAIEVLAIEHDFEELIYIIKRNREGGGMSINANASANPTQSVSQDVKIDIDQKVSLVVKEIEQNLKDEQIEVIKPLIEEYKKKPTRSATEKLLGGIFDLGKDIGVGIISNIISKQMGI